MGQVLNFSVSFPAMMIVCVYFWTVYFIDRELIYPVRMESIYPQWVSCIEHGLVFPIGLLNILHQPFRMSKTLACGLIWMATFSYYAWLRHIFNVTGKWVYPFMDAMGSDTVNYLLFPVTLVIVSLVQQLGWKLNTMAHPTKQKTKKK